MWRYTLDLFCGTYDITYAESRLRVGRVHGRIGVPSKYYIAAMGMLVRIIGAVLEPQTGSPLPPSALKRLILLDMSLIFDTFTHGLTADLEAKNEELVAYSNELERLVRERTAQIERAARTDELTGLLNRRSFAERLEEALDDSRARDSHLCLVFLDLDGFKRVNDAEGHTAGDALLKRFGQILRHVCRAGDLAFRFGGDEFCLILPETDAAGGQILCGRLAEEASARTATPVAFSAGIAVAGQGVNMDPDRLIAAADRQMYACKARKGPARLMTVIDSAKAVGRD